MGPRARSTASSPRPSWRRQGRRALVAGVAVGLLAGASSAPALARGGSPAQAEPAGPADGDRAAKALADTLALAPDGPRSPDDPFAAVVTADEQVTEAAFARMSASEVARTANVVALTDLGARDRAKTAEQAAEQVRDDARTELATERDRLSDLTVRAYITGGTVDLDLYRDVMAGDTSDPAANREIMFTQVLDRQQTVTDQARRDLAKARDALTVARALLADAQATAEASVAEAAIRRREQVDAEAAHERAVAAAAEARADLRTAGSRAFSMVPLDVPIIGLPRLSAADLTEWFARSPYRPRVSTPIADYAAWFIAEGNAEGIRGDIAFAQAVLETGGFANNDSVAANNFSGIGHCDSCPSGWRFATPELGVRAQIQLLKSYAVRTPAYASPLVDRRLRGPAGCCDTWGDLTTVWATDPGYGPKVMLLYSSLVDFALDRRAAGLE